jgi:hypothetical protein
MAAANDLTLDIKEPQILLNFPGDAAGFFWHQRILLKKLGGGRWICVSPDYDFEVVDMNVRVHVVLDRRAPFPGAQLAAAYIFDPVGRQELERLRNRARTMATILDDADPDEVEAARWIYADISDPNFGQDVADAAVNQGVSLGDLGLVERDGENVFTIRMSQSKIDAWKLAKKGSLGDLRLLGDHRDPRGNRFLSFNAALALMRPTQFADWKLAGPQVLFEYLTAIQEAGVDLSAYHLTWVRNSGVSSWASVAHEHRILIEIVRLATVVDQLDISNLLSFENIGRRLVQIETAVSRSPQSPDFSGLEVIMVSPVSAAGQAQTLKFTEWVTGRLKELANIKKQARLYHEEFRGGGGGGRRGGGRSGSDGGGRGAQPQEEGGGGRGGRGRRGRGQKGSGTTGAEAGAAES